MEITKRFSCFISIHTFRKGQWIFDFFRFQKSFSFEKCWKNIFCDNMKFRLPTTAQIVISEFSWIKLFQLKISFTVKWNSVRMLEQDRQLNWGVYSEQTGRATSQQSPLNPPHGNIAHHTLHHTCHTRWVKASQQMSRSKSQLSIFPMSAFSASPVEITKPFMNHELN